MKVPQDSSENSHNTKCDNWNIQGRGACKEWNYKN